MADEIRRVRTQAERDTDGQAWRAVAASRPGYATYPDTRPGNPSWLRATNPAIGIPVTDEAIARALADTDGPTPVDGETCKRWCGYCHLGTGQPAPPTEQDMASFRQQWTPPAPRRRWWHRYTRRNT